MLFVRLQVRPLISCAAKNSSETLCGVSGRLFHSTTLSASKPRLIRIPAPSRLLSKLQKSRPSALPICFVDLRRSFSDKKNAQTILTDNENADNNNKNIKEIIPTHENIYTIPNLLTFGRLLSAPYIGHLIIQHDYNLALGIFALAGFTDMLDGWIARRYNLKTVVGSIIDPAADKALMTVMTITLAMEGVLPVPLATLILGRDAGLILASFYYRYISLPQPVCEIIPAPIHIYIHI
ncbi:CDP-alcohol phosphatidyltransferase-domain-containing protein [Phycomyces blakesleeanus]|uniref:CDP-alcohol phosphatidyltransferase-domain-containing protein n=1 Tax=Phycomyces blakesleeanus TaxID=4837 RepID=A0ABR3ATM6_PHYBL